MKKKTKYIIDSVIAIFLSWIFATKVAGSPIALWYGIMSFILGIGGIFTFINSLIEE